MRRHCLWSNQTLLYNAPNRSELTLYPVWGCWLNANVHKQRSEGRASGVSCSADVYVAFARKLQKPHPKRPTEYKESECSLARTFSHVTFSLSVCAWTWRYRGGHREATHWTRRQRVGSRMASRQSRNQAIAGQQEGGSGTLRVRLLRWN